MSLDNDDIATRYNKYTHKNFLVLTFSIKDFKTKMQKPVANFAPGSEILKLWLNLYIFDLGVLLRQVLAC